MLYNKRISVLIPAFNEEKAIAQVIKELPRDIVDEIVVVDNASTDATQEVALRSGARVVKEPRRGYGAACLRGLASIESADIVVILDGDHSDYPEQINRLVEPIAAGRADFVIGSRILGKREDGALTPQAYWGNKLAVFLIYILFEYKFTDMGPFRAISHESLEKLNMSDKGFGWNAEMQIKAVRNGLKIKEVAVDYRKRIGVSKISGTFSGTIKAGIKIISTIIRYSFLKNYFTCKECGLIYKQQAWAIKCEEWCAKYNSCNLEITMHAMKKQDIMTNRYRNEV
ncbi:MAG: UDP-glucose--dolichyl-phosphate glucosyltransferase [Candidatus Omnitrophica bacterium CG_4_10_14_0_8_um_filter_44_12]|nr:MAG: UDP-glucose--dolichyl-phosphate glucosyltransferase [Candidatus Omnitrophica bacterium CG_4_10_14_0_8_um_filter_44_12]